MELLQDTYIWYIFSFAIFIVIAVKFGKSAILGMLDSRIEQIRKDIEEAENLNTEAQEMLAQYQRKYRDAIQEADEITKTAKDHATAQVAEADKQLKETIARREKQLQDRIQAMEETAKKEIQSYAAQLSVNAATQIIQDKLDKKANENLIESGIKNVGKMSG